MGKLTGNQFWKLRTKHGRDKLFGDPAVLLEEAYAYFDWCDRHPQNRAELVKYKGDYEEAAVPLGQPYSVDGFTCYLAVSRGYFWSAKANIRNKMELGKASRLEEELFETIELIEQLIRTQQIAGAMVGIFNANLTARLNGIADKQDITTNGAPVIRVGVRDKNTDEDLYALDDLL